MRKDISFNNLPHGAGAAIGNFVRSVYMTGSSKLAIVGISIDKLGFFDHLPQTTTLVSDVVCGIISESYTIKQDIESLCLSTAETDLGTIYVVPVPIVSATELSTSAFSRVMSIHSKTLAQFQQPQSLTVTFYIMDVHGVMREDMASACILDAFKENSLGIIPLASEGQHDLNCWHTIQKNEFSEDLTIHFEAPDEIFESDFEYLKSVVGQYLSSIIDKLLNPSS